jgi:DNA-binding MarR family transcriptional regulator
VPGQERAKGIAARTVTYEVSNRIFFRLFQLGNLLQRQSMSEIGISTVQWAVLGALSRPQYADGMTVNDLAQYLLVSRQNLNGVLGRLERDQLSKRSGDLTDRRIKKVCLTQKGRELWLRLEADIDLFYGQATASFNLDERIALAHYMNKLHSDLQKVELHER